MEKIASILLIACCATSFFSVLYERKAGYLRVFPIYFLISSFVQTYGMYLSEHGKTNIVLYNVFSSLEFGFYFFVLRYIIQSPKTKRVLLWLGILYPAFSILNIFLYQGENVFHTLTYGAGCLLVGLFCILFFVEMFQMPKAIDLMKLPAFWICTAALVSYICTFPFWGMVNMMTLSFSMFHTAIIMVNVINILSYILFLIAFLCRIKIRKSTL